MTTEELHLNNIQTGTEIVSITPINGGFKYGMIKVVKDYSENHGKWRLRFPDENRDLGLLPNDGRGYYSMNPHEVRFYYSANPKHIEAAKKAHEEARKAREEEEQANREKLSEFKQKLDNLLEEYGASIHPEQLSGDDQGVELGVIISIKNQLLGVDSL